ncbi:hypothetical protein Y032_0018g3634 [Ancylostoma ceylanicum]|uniref:Uncharacterized protein n=1 Tax=Ancylostoma ceylanicum TaxID=53326 RepID=A0A016V5G7_9BILA|nr:hypothetical protein Y032_0018g3634 [Ancylostoma ceylanicum]
MNFALVNLFVFRSPSFTTTTKTRQPQGGCLPYILTSPSISLICLHLGQTCCHPSNQPIVNTFTLGSLNYASRLWPRQLRQVM